MPDVAFKDLCIDATAGGDGPAAVARFWGAALGQSPATGRDGDPYLAPPEGGPTSRRMWVNTVPEPLAGKSLVHIDVRLPDGDPAPLLALGGAVERASGEPDPWWVLRDPQGVNVCVFGPHPADPSALGPFELVVDSADPAAIAAWWAARTGGTVGTRPGADFVWVEGAAGFPYMFWVFGKVPEPKTTKNRIHWDVTLADATVDGLVAAGATVLREPDDVIDWWVLADPEGNEFCVFRP
jgi:hypothetical protein